MSVKSDKWIRRMAEEQGMIEPFEAGQVKTKGEERLISYGTSSYGYDVRCSDEFKIFTNVHSATVDPKNFDEKSFVDIKADSCIIPPNSFALARTVEFFRIPRNVLTICSRQIDLRPLRDYRQCHTTRARMGRACDVGIFKYDDITSKDLCQ